MQRSDTMEGNDMGLIVFLGLLILLVVIVVVISIAASVAGTVAAVADEESMDD